MNTSETQNYVFCGQCGEKLKAEDRFCKKCGASIATAKESLLETTSPLLNDGLPRTPATDTFEAHIVESVVPRKRPIGIIILAAISLIIAGFAIWNGVVVSLAYFIEGDALEKSLGSFVDHLHEFDIHFFDGLVDWLNTGEGWLNTRFDFLILSLFVTGAFFVFMSYGLWKLRKWAYIILVGAVSIAIVCEVLDFFIALFHFEIMDMIGYVIVIAIYFLFIRYLLKPRMKQAFGILQR